VENPLATELVSWMERKKESMSNLTLACVAELSEEARRIESLIRSVDQSLADPHISLAEGMRLANWIRQLEGYLEGIRFALGGTERSYMPKENQAV